MDLNLCINQDIPMRKIETLEENRKWAPSV